LLNFLWFERRRVRFRESFATTDSVNEIDNHREGSGGVTDLTGVAIFAQYFCCFAIN